MQYYIFWPELQKNSDYFFRRDIKRFNCQIKETCQMLAYVLPFKLPKKDGGWYVANNKSMENRSIVKWTLKNVPVVLIYLYFLLQKMPNHFCNEVLKTIVSEILLNVSKYPFTYAKVCTELVQCNPNKDKTLAAYSAADWQWHVKMPQPFADVYRSYRWYLSEKQKAKES